MIGLTRVVRVFAYNGPVDLRKGFNGLSALVEQEMKNKLLDGDVYLFLGRKPRRAKVLYFDGTGCAYCRSGSSADASLGRGNAPALARGR